jgi:hypothetical protein
MLFTAVTHLDEGLCLEILPAVRITITTQILVIIVITPGTSPETIL